jgi:hypothetical protein
MPIDRPSGGHDDPAKQEPGRLGDQPAGTNPGEGSPTTRRWLDIDSASDDELASFLGLDRTDRPQASETRDQQAAYIESKPRPQEFADPEYAAWYRNAEPTERQRVPAPFDQRLAESLPEWQKGAKAEGLLNRPDTGESLWGDRPLKSGYDGPAKLFEPSELGLGDDWANLSHVETHAAATMRARSDETSEAVLYLNRRPCEGIYGCYDNLERMLPEGAKVTAYWPGDWHVFIGRPDEEGNTA